MAFALLAQRMGFRFAPIIHAADPGASIDAEAIRRGTHALSADRPPVLYIAPQPSELQTLSAWLRETGADRDRMQVAPPSAIRAALTRASAPRLVAHSSAMLARKLPALSAERTLTEGQRVILFLALAALLSGLALAPWPALAALDLLAGFLFFSVSLIRFLAAAGAALPGPPAAAPLPDEALPVYTVLVALRDEAAVVPELVAGLGRLDWPREKLDIKLIVEEDDAPTRAAVEAAAHGPPFEVLVVPVAAPRTKPKALAFALPLARGELVTVYDAEDRPHPQQLREAAAAFAEADTRLACLQAPLVVENGGRSWVAQQFAIEYAALFDGLLPALERLGMPLPLGGTSNHFRRRALTEVGGWDPYNVTEDADIGIRLARFGYRAGMLSLPTLEPGPLGVACWTAQRARWFKGWMQTFLVHMRSPSRLARELGPRQTAGFHLVTTGMLAAALIHPIYLATLFFMIVDPAFLVDGEFWRGAVVGLNLFNLAAGYAAMVLLALSALPKRRLTHLAPGLVLLPAYWMMMSFACYRAVWQLIRRPHHWSKTRHDPRPAESGADKAGPDAAA